MTPFLKKYKTSLTILVIVIILLILDIFSVPSLLGIQLHAEWVSAILDLCVGILTIHLTFSIAQSQSKIESDKIASEKFFKVSFIHNYQRIEISDTYRDLRLKIREFDDNILSTIKITNDVKVTKIKNGVLSSDPADQLTLRIRHKEYEMEHTDAGMDKECNENPSGFCYARFEILDDLDLAFFEPEKTYRFDFDIVATNIFGVEVKSHLSPWFKVVKRAKSAVDFSVTHNFGHYDSVRYVGSGKSN